MKRIFLFITILTINCYSQSIWIDTKDVSQPDIYPWITFLSESEPIWLKMQTKEEVTSFAFRVIVTTSEIYDSMYFEKVTYGQEGCCKKIEYIKQFDMMQFAKEFSLEGELSGLKFIKWQKDHSFDFEIQGHRFNIQISKEKVLVNKIPAG